MKKTFKHNFFRSLAFLAIGLFCGCLPAMASTQYCGETITGVNTNHHKATITCKSLGNNQYQFIFVSEDAFTSYNTGSNFYSEINGVGGYQVSSHLNQDGNTLSVTMESNQVPRFYANDFFVVYSDGEEHYQIPTDIDWTATCTGGESGGGSSAPTGYDTWTSGTNSIDLYPYHYKDNKYVLTVKSEGKTLALNGDNFYWNVNGVGTKMLTDYSIENGVITFSATSTSAPQMYTDMFLLVDGDQVNFGHKDFNWIDKTSESAPGGSSDPAEQTSLPNFGSAGHWATPDNKEVFYQFFYADGNLTVKLNSLIDYPLDFAEVHVLNKGNYAMTKDGNGYTYTLAVTSGEDVYLRFLYHASNMDGNHMTAENVSATDAHIIHWRATDVSVPATTKDVNFALATQGSTIDVTSVGENLIGANAIDGNDGTRWASEWKVDPQDVVVNMGQRRLFNTIQIRWQNAYAKKYDLMLSDNGTDWVTIKSISRDLANADGYEESVDLGFDVAAQYVKFHGTERALLDYGYSFFEFRVLYPGTSTLTTFTATPASAITKVGGTNAITVAAKDQNGRDMDATITYTVSPADAGSVTNNVYTPSKSGLATITAKASAGGVELSATAFTVYAYAGENVALNKTATAAEGSGENDISYLTDGIDGVVGTEWQGDPVHGTNHDVTCGFTLDLGTLYDLTLVTIHFEGACSDAYTLETSADGASWNTAYSFSGSLGINNHTDYLYDSNLANNSNVQYLKFTSSKNSTDWGMKIYEFQVFGTEAATPTKTVSVSVNDATMGSATVKQNDVEVTEVDKGSSVTFAATPKDDDHIFQGWYNGETLVTTTNPYTVEVNSNTSLTAHFRALGATYCLTEMTATNNSKKAYVTMKRTAENTYCLTVRAEETLTGFGGTELDVNNTEVNIRDLGELSNNNMQLSYSFSSTSEPAMRGPLYVIYSNGGEAQFTKLENIEYSVACDDTPVPTSVELSKSTAEVILGETLSLTASVHPLFVGQGLTWSTSDDQIATVDENGVVTPVAVGTVTITATSTVDATKSASCSVMVSQISAKTWWGSGEVDGMSCIYSITRNVDKTLTYTAEISGGNATVYQLNDGDWRNLTNNNGVWTWTSTATYTSGTIINGYFYFPNRFEFSYTVGDENSRPQVAVTEVNISATTAALTPAETKQLSASVLPSNATNKSITWSSDNTSVATVSEDGLVTAVASGTATITATSVEGSKTATCVVTVTAQLEATVWHGAGTDLDDEVDVVYTITRNVDRTLTYAAAIAHQNQDFTVQVNDGSAYHNATLENGVYTWTSSATYDDGASITGFFYMPYYGGKVAGVDFTYTVGSSNEAAPRSFEVKSSRPYVSLYLPYKTTIPAGVKVYTGNLDEARSSLVMNEVTGVLPALTGVVVEMGSDGSEKSYTFTESYDAPAAIYNNSLKGTLTKKAPAAESDKTVVTLGYDANGNPGFRKPADAEGKIGANKAYMYVTTPANGAPAHICMSFAPMAPTCLDAISAQGQNQKFFLNGQLYIRHNNQLFNAAGQLVK